MARKGENIRKRKDGRWEGRYKNGLRENGTAKYASVYGKTYTEVKNKLVEHKRTIFLCENDPYTEKRFDEILVMWMKSHQIKIKESTEAKYHYAIERHIKPLLGLKKVSSLTAPVINRFLFEKRQSGRLDGGGGLSASYVKTMAIIIDSAIKFACNEGYCRPLKSAITKPTVGKKEPDILSVAAQQRFERLAITAPDETVTGIFIALYAGLRIGEICALTWENIDFEKQIIRVRHTVTRVPVKTDFSATGSVLKIDVPKTKASIRDIPISPILMPILKTMKCRSVSKYVISNREGFVSTRTFDYRYKKVLKKFGIRAINFHALRHTFATRCVEVGMDIKSLSQMLGHSNVSITLNTYVHPSMDTMRTQIEKLGMVMAR